MRSILRTPVLLLIVLGVSAGSALGARPDVYTEHFGWTDQLVEVGCYEPVLITEEVSAVVHVTETESWFILSGSFRISGSWSEDTDGDPATPDENFGRTGTASAPLSIRLTPGGAGGYTDIFTAAVIGDQGTRGVFRYRGHLTVAPDGKIAVELERFGGECRPRG